MNDVVVHRCVLRIRRTAGWAWGASPEALLAAATRALPAAIMANLPGLAATTATPIRISAPVRVRVEATVAELAALAGAVPVTGSGAADFALVRRVGVAVALAVEAAAAVAGRDGSGSTPAVALANDAQDLMPELRELDPAGSIPSSAAWRAVRAWWRAGAVEQIVATLDGRAVVALHDTLLPAASGTTGASSVLVAAARQVAALPDPPACALAALRRRIVLAAALFALEPAPNQGSVAAAVDAVVDRPAGAAIAFELAAAGAASPTTAEANASPPAPASARAPTATTPPIAARGTPSTELELRSVLPFLLLPSLHHAGWLDAAAALLDAHDIPDAAFALAAGLAAKVLDAPDRGWMRTRADRAVIAAFAGADEPIAEERVATASMRLAPVLSLLDASLRGLLGRARGSSAPMVLWREPRGWTLIDGDGCTAVATGSTLAAAIAAAAGALVIVPAACADPAVLDQLDLANARFVTDAPRLRGEPWRSVAGLRGRLATNDTSVPGPRLAAIVGDLDQRVALAAELVEAFEARPAVARHAAAALDATCTLAATAALSDLAARLFPAEATTPILALTRFRDLDARVRFDADEIRVRIPLGRRHADLMKHGFLTTIPRVPWLDGRAVDLGGA